jgi:undecaprenyl-diphosphatase
MQLKKLISLKGFIHELITKEIKVLIVLLILFISGLTFLEIADEISEGETREFDQSIIEFFRTDDDPGNPAGANRISELMIDITALGGGTVLAIITIFVSIFLILQKRYDAFWLLLAATAGGALISFGLKEIYARERPDLVYRLVTVNSLSFPSGHSMMSAVLYLTQAAIVARFQREWKIRIYIVSIALFLTFIIGLSRVYLGVHYPTDVIGGWTIGLAWACFCWCVVWYIQRRKRVTNKANETGE